MNLPDHRTFVILTGGNLSPLIYSKMKVPVECVNDVDGRVSLFFRYARLHRRALEADLSVPPRDPRVGTELRFCREFFVSSSKFLKSETVSEKIDEMIARFERVCIDCLSPAEIIRFYDGENTVFLADPEKLFPGEIDFPREIKGHLLTLDSFAFPHTLEFLKNETVFPVSRRKVEIV